MFDRSAARSGARSAPTLLASTPWIVVLLGVGLLAVLLLFAMLSFRGAEHQAAPEPAPPMYLPRLPATPAAVASTDTPLVVAGATRSPSVTPTPSPSVTSPRPTASPSSSRKAGTSGSGRVTAAYRATSSDRDSFAATLTVRNGTGGAQEWEVELLFTGNVKSIRASSSSGLSVRTRGSGWFVLRGTGPLPAGESAVVSMTFSRSGSGDRPGQCTVNGAACTIG
ncbi:cellulose binding domain-containing protein [Micromonospora coxensis]|uniref:Cellulose binding domain-containing protein n=1 Tax=Micromonospora coxensis TaxID=356852 RepID=A0A1C5HH12_9ACTN|nr:cellulose binding domain-containing protein [Micromonospora coxensis]SCG45203.1 Cellulose binding domain-containing protein [Micromonospora coxensis]